MVLVARPDQQPDSSARRRESTAAKRALELGKHNDEVFKELGFDLNEIERLSTSGVIPKPATPAKAASEIRSRSTFSEMSVFESLRKR